MGHKHHSDLSDRRCTSFLTLFWGQTYHISTFCLPALLALELPAPARVFLCFCTPSAQTSMKEVSASLLHLRLNQYLSPACQYARTKLRTKCIVDPTDPNGACVPC